MSNLENPRMCFTHYQTLCKIWWNTNLIPGCSATMRSNVYLLSCMLVTMLRSTDCFTNHEKSTLFLMEIKVRRSIECQLHCQNLGSTYSRTSSVPATLTRSFPLPRSLLDAVKIGSTCFPPYTRTQIRSSVYFMNTSAWGHWINFGIISLNSNSWHGSSFACQGHGIFLLERTTPWSWGDF